MVKGVSLSLTVPSILVIESFVKPNTFLADLAEDIVIKVKDYSFCDCHNV